MGLNKREIVKMLCKSTITTTTTIPIKSIRAITRAITPR